MLLFHATLRDRDLGLPLGRDANEFERLSARCKSQVLMQGLSAPLTVHTSQNQPIRNMFAALSHV